MKRRFNILLVIAALFYFVSCEKIEPPFKETNQGGGGDDTTALVRKVLLEDYTGHRCVNCAGAAQTSYELKELYNDQLILMAVHAGFYAQPMGLLYSADYRTEAGNQWNDFFGIQEYPSGMVNRKEYNGEQVLGEKKWGEAIASILSESAEAKIDIDNSFEDGKLNTEIKVKFINEMTGNYMLQVCITEDSIISAQANNDSLAGPTPVIENYVFMHMLRGAVNGVWGEDIFNETIVPGKEYSVTYQYNITGVAKNSHVVAFVYKQDDKEIIQAEEVPVLNE